MAVDTAKNIAHLLEKHSPLLEQCNSLIQDTLQSPAPQVADMAQTLSASRGKQLRPLISFTLAAGHSQAIEIAAVFEAIHCASLVHDDVIDNCATRRKLPTMNALHNDSVALLIGDVLFTSVFQIAARLPSWVCAGAANTIKELAEGELLQQAYKNKLDVTREQYLSVLRKKTASLLSFTSSASAQLAGKSPQDAQLAAEFADAFGLIFQIADDWADFTKAGTQDNKDRGADIGNGFITLPWILLLEHSAKKTAITELIQGGQRCGMNLPIISEQAKAIQLTELMEAEIFQLREKAYNCLKQMSDNMPTNDLEIFLQASLATFKK